MVREGGRQPESKTVVFSVLHSESVLTEEPTAQVRCCPSFSIALSPIVCRRSCRDSTRTLLCSRLLCKQKGRKPFLGNARTNQDKPALRNQTSFCCPTCAGAAARAGAAT